MSYDVIIPAAGLGTRLRPLTDSLPKGLVKYKNREIMLRQLDILQENDISKLIVVVGYQKKKYLDFFQNHEFNFQVKTVFNENFATTGCSVSLLKALEFVENDFIYINSDLIFTKTALSKVLHHPEKNAIGIRSLHNNDETVLQKVEINRDGFLKRMALKLSGNYAFEAVGPAKFCFNSKSLLVNKYNSLSFSLSNKIPCYSLFGKCLDEIMISGAVLDENEWFEINTLDDYNENKI